MNPSDRWLDPYRPGTLDKLSDLQRIRECRERIVLWVLWGARGIFSYEQASWRVFTEGSLFHTGQADHTLQSPLFRKSKRKPQEYSDYKSK